MNWLGVFLIVFGAWILVSTIASIVTQPSRSVMSWFWTVLWILGGGYALYTGYVKVTAPPPTILGAVTGAVTGGRRKYW